ncbi:hypothetical protein KI387_037688 [Taxus chinensis]|uniref:Uncharacterized protein n=1 Tax=Taxus chinensis TaxID=29808 RepID=A0AA38FSV5_TAXCH|nr:hypothetical protein KI387_037688 [Taxus chinensis]
MNFLKFYCEPCAPATTPGTHFRSKRSRPSEWLSSLPNKEVSAVESIQGVVLTAAFGWIMPWSNSVLIVVCKVMGVTQRLTLPLIPAQHPDKDLAAITTLSFLKRGFTEIIGLDACEKLSRLDLEKLSRLDLSNNNLSSLEGLALCTTLKWLSVARNCLHTVKGIESFSKLIVLYGNHNEFTSMDEVASLVDLRDVILNDNEIDLNCRMDRLVNFNTLVLSHNPIQNLGKSLE